MARVFIGDRWLRNAPDGTPPTAAMRRSLANAKDPMKAKVPPEHRTSVYGRYDRWRCRWYVTDQQGRRIEKTRTFRLLSDAESFKAAVEDDLRRGRYHDPKQSERPFNSVADEWLATKMDIKPGTLGRYRRELRVYINPTWGGTPIGDITTQNIQQWVTTLTEGGYPADLPNGRPSRPLRPRSIRNIVRIVMGGVLTHAHDNGYLADNPMSRVVTPKIVSEDDDMVFLTIPEVEDLAHQAGLVKHNPTDELIIRWQAYTGMRIGETFALRVRDVDPTRRRVRVRQTWTDDGTGKSILGTPKNGKARWAAYPGFLDADLRERCAGHGPDEFVFRAKRGGNLWVHTWRSRVWTPALRQAGMEDEAPRIHDLRHTYASIAIANGCDVKTLQSQLGHSSATITLDTYAKLWPERLDEVADAIDGARESALADPTAIPAGHAVIG